MLSFDISDRIIYAVKGENAGGKIKIDKSCEIEIPADMIVSGEVVNLTGVSDTILKKIREENMFDKNAIITFSSNNIVFKELVIPKAKPDQFLSMVQNQMVHEMGLTNDFSISYTIVGEAGADNPGAMKVLATACPFAVVESYRKLFGVMGINLRSANISCNSISRIVLSDKSNASKMPLLVMQIDPSFLGMTLFENGQMAFARYVPIDPDDYGTDDYLIEALTENIFRMTQFNKARGGPGIENVILYGEIGDYIRYADELRKMNISISVLPVPAQITGYENFEFTIYANAIGALYKRNKLTERINLIEVDSSTGRSSAGNKQFFALLLGGVAIVCGAVIIGKIGLAAWNSSVRKDINKMKEDIATAEEQIEQAAKYEVMLEKLTNYRDGAKAANEAFDTLPILTVDAYNTIVEMAAEHGAVKGEDTQTGFTDFSYSIEGTITIENVRFNTLEDLTAFVREISKCDDFYGFEYTGYDTETIGEDPDNPDSGELVYVVPSMTVILKEANFDELNKADDAQEGEAE